MADGAYGANDMLEVVIFPCRWVWQFVGAHPTVLGGSRVFRKKEIIFIGTT